jgi:hypothetical protein
MTTDANVERLYQQIELVRGVGDRGRGQLCVMSFVAFLAGEGHTDNPVTASTLIRRFAMTINDEMPDAMRQRLKAFAPRILGTRDAHDLARTRLLIEAARTELLPRICADFGEAARSGVRVTRAMSGRRADRLPELCEQVASMASHGCNLWNAQTCEDVASAVARLISRCGHMAMTPAQRDWYWLKGIDLLDRLTDVGADEPRPAVPAERVRVIEDFLRQRQPIIQRRARTAAALARVRSLIPVLMR